MTPEGEWHVGVPGLFANSYETVLEANYAVEYYLKFFETVEIWSDEICSVLAGLAEAKLDLE